MHVRVHTKFEMFCEWPFNQLYENLHLLKFPVGERFVVSCLILLQLGVQDV